MVAFRGISRGALPHRDGDNSSSSPAASSELSTSRRLGVLGIGLIMEEAGKGARLVFRYPASPPPFFLHACAAGEQAESNVNGPGQHATRGSHHNETSKIKHGLGPSSEGGSNEDSNNANGSTNIFFDLPARVISKLFRPKRPLCGQPLTLNVSGTTFCCRAELFDPQPSTSHPSDCSNHPLVLFSVIVALAPLAPSTAEELNLPHSNSTQYPFDFSNSNPSNAENAHSHASSSSQYVRSDAAFTTIRCVHRNLARLCKTLTREEIRCRYVSRQCNMLIQIRKDYEARVGPDCIGISGGSDSGGTATSAAGADSSSSKKGEPSAKEKPPVNSKSNESKHSTAVSDETERPEMSRAQRREYIQNLIEIMIASPPPNDDFEGKCWGNLARELAHVFHWISSPPKSPASMSRATAQEGVVYINRHVAVPLDPVTEPPQTQYCVQYYHALLFPKSSPSEVLNGLLVETVGINEMTTNPSMIISLRRILPHIQPCKNLQEISFDACLSLPHAMDAASWLVHSGVCVAEMPVLRKNSYVCAGGVVTRMAKMALPFWQTFGVRSQHCKFYWGGEGGGAANKVHNAGIDNGAMQRRKTVTTGAPHVFVIVSAVSASPTLGEAIDGLSQDPTGSGVYESTQIVYSMAVWLIANKVIVENQKML